MSTDQLVVAAVVKRAAPVLSVFLTALQQLQGPGTAVVLLEPGADQRRTALLTAFAEGTGATVIGRSHGTNDNDNLLRYAVDHGASHVLLVDDGILLPPPLPAHLQSLGRDIVAGVYWTEWRLGDRALPNVWVCDEYSFHPRSLSQASDEDKRNAAVEFLERLRTPGTYQVGGVSGCTLVSARAVRAGVSFSPLPNLSYWSEERHFSLRAAACGFDLWADTQYPPLNLFRDADMALVPSFMTRWATEGAVL